jgi:hypothetical protein
MTAAPLTAHPTQRHKALKTQLFLDSVSVPTGRRMDFRCQNGAGSPKTEEIQLIEPK